MVLMKNFTKWCLKNSAYFIATAIFLTPVCCYSAIQVVNSSLLHEYKVSRGDSVQGKVQLRNNGSAAERVRINKKDIVFSKFGEANYKTLEEKANPRSNAAWITFNTANDKNLSAQENYEFEYTINIPNDPNIKGSFWSTLMIEPQTALDINNTNIDKKEITVVTKARYAIMLVTTITDGSVDISVMEHKIKTVDDKKLLEIDIKNNGESIYRMKSELQLYNSNGEYIFNKQLNSKAVYPESTNSILFDISEVKKGTYNALIMFEGDDESLQGVQYDIVIE